MTRRTLKDVAVDEDSGFTYYKGKTMLDIHNWKELILEHCPYGQVGDLIWVRESWNHFPKDFPHTMNNKPYCYRADFTPVPNCEVAKEDQFKWKPSIHMPKAAARIWLEITEITVERLWDISEEDAKAEGATANLHDISYKEWGVLDKFPPVHFLEYQKYFFELWVGINGPESWNSNPWVWVVKFKKIDTK
jgi:hypothetical protein